jgi:hypothetical protein
MVSGDRWDGYSWKKIIKVNINFSGYNCHEKVQGSCRAWELFAKVGENILGGQRSMGGRGGKGNEEHKDKRNWRVRQAGEGGQLGLCISGPMSLGVCSALS